MKERQAATTQNRSRMQDRQKTDSIEGQRDYQTAVASPDQRLRRAIMAAEQRLKRLETLLRKASGDKRWKTRMKMLQNSAEEQRQEIAQLKAISAETHRGVLKTKATRYVTSRPKRKRDSEGNLVDDLKKLKRWMN